MPLDNIAIKGAREHNLKNINVTIPRDKLIAVTGVSGSGKSSLAFDTIYAEGQRRYMESLAAYARQFLGRMEKPDVDYIEGLSPAISIDQKGTSHNPRSTVGTVTEIYDYLRLLFARVGHPHCPQCGREISRQTIQQIVDAVQQIPGGSRIMILAPLVKDRKGEHRTIFDDLRKAGYVRVRINGNIHDLSEDFEVADSLQAIDQYSPVVEIIFDDQDSLSAHLSSLSAAPLADQQRAKEKGRGYPPRPFRIPCSASVYNASQSKRSSCRSVTPADATLRDPRANAHQRS